MNETKTIRIPNAEVVAYDPATGVTVECPDCQARMSARTFFDHYVDVHRPPPFDPERHWN